MTYFGVRLNSLRKQDSMTQIQLADALGVKKSTIGMWENGKREPDFETLETIADFFNVPISTFFPPDKDTENMTVSSQEQEVLSMLRQLSEDQQRTFLAFLTSLTNTQEP